MLGAGQPTHPRIHGKDLALLSPSLLPLPSDTSGGSSAAWGSGTSDSAPTDSEPFTCPWPCREAPGPEARLPEALPAHPPAPEGDTPGDRAPPSAQHTLQPPCLLRATGLWAWCAERVGAAGRTALAPRPQWEDGSRRRLSSERMKLHEAITNATARGPRGAGARVWRPSVGSSDGGWVGAALGVAMRSPWHLTD